jgi:carboxylesterase
VPLVFIGFAALLAAGALRSLARHRIERSSLARRPVGPDGIIIGAQPVALDGSGDGAILLLHGFGDTPQSLGSLAVELNRRRWTVRVPLLAGHGRRIRVFAHSGAADWLAGARAALADLRAQHSAVAIVGLSMGGALATILAAEDPSLVALVLLAPYLEMPSWLRAVASAHWLIDAAAPYLRGGGTRSIGNAAARARSRAYDATTARLVAELDVVARQAHAALPRVSVPTLIMQSPRDNRIHPDVARRALARVGAADRRLVWTTEGTHIITVDDGAESVAQTVGDWVDTHMVQYATRDVVAAASNGAFDTPLASPGVDNQ